MSALWLWWIGAAVLVGAELLVGSIYLLALGIAFAIGGVAAWLGASPEIQLTVAAVLGVGLTVAAHQWRRRRAAPVPPVPFDVGQTVQVQAWQPDGTARVAYRGSQWTAELATPDTPRDEIMAIVAMKGSVLVIGPHRA